MDRRAESCRVASALEDRAEGEGMGLVGIDERSGLIEARILSGETPKIFAAAEGVGNPAGAIGLSSWCRRACGTQALARLVINDGPRPRSDCDRRGPSCP